MSRKRGIMMRDDMQAPSSSLARLRDDQGNPYQDLANAIVCVAADDYRTALEMNDPSLLSSLQHFFRSTWCSILTNVDTERLMSTLNAEYEAHFVKLRSPQNSKP